MHRHPACNCALVRRCPLSGVSCRASTRQLCPHLQHDVREDVAPLRSLSDAIIPLRNCIAAVGVLLPWRYTEWILYVPRNVCHAHGSEESKRLMASPETNR